MNLTCPDTRLESAVSRKGHWKMGTCTKLAEIDLQIRDKFATLLKNKRSAQRGSFRHGYPADIRGTFARISLPKSSVRALKIVENQAFGRGHPEPEGADVHNPKGLPKTSVRKSVGSMFVS